LVLAGWRSRVPGAVPARIGAPVQSRPYPRGGSGQDPRGRDKTLRDASSRATKAFYPALSMCDLIFSGVFEKSSRASVV
jgi:hypothetical protein